MRIWHYTIGLHLPAIWESGVIRLATAGVPRRERPAAWFSTNPVWEHSANRGCLDAETMQRFGRQAVLVAHSDEFKVFWGRLDLAKAKRTRLTKEETHEVCGGLARIEVKPEAVPYTWAEFKRMSNIGHREAKVVEKTSRGVGADPAEWRASFEPVPISEWLAIEVWNGSQWTMWPLLDWAS